MSLRLPIDFSSKRLHCTSGRTRQVVLAAVMVGASSTGVCRDRAPESSLSEAPPSGLNAAAPRLWLPSVSQHIAGHTLAAEPPSLGQIRPDERRASSNVHVDTAQGWSRRDAGRLDPLRMSLSPASVLQLRPRAGGMAVTYRSQF